MLTVDDDEDEAVEFSSSNCCTCRMSTYSSSWFCDDDDDAADDEAAAAEISAEFGRLPLKKVEEFFLDVVTSQQESFYLTWLISTIIWCSITVNGMIIQMR